MLTFILQNNDAETLIAMRGAARAAHRLTFAVARGLRAGASRELRLPKMSLILNASDAGESAPMSIPVNVHRPRDATARVVESVHAGRGFSFFTLNLDHLSRLSAEPGFLAAYRAADFISADGWPIVWLMQSQGVNVERTTGADLIEPLCAAAARESFGVYFVGPSAASQAKALPVLRERNPGLQILGAETPAIPDRFDDEFVQGVAARIRASGASLCFLALGSPKQELLAHRLRALCPAVGFIGVGAGIDFLSGEAVRAPERLQRWRLEWLWRVMRDPRRLAARYWRCGTFFSAILLRALFDRRALTIVRGD